MPSSHETYEPLLYPLLAIGGTSNPGYGAHYFQPTLAGKVTLQNYTRYRTLSIEREQEADGSYRRDADGNNVVDPRWFAKTKGGLMWPFSRLDCMGRLAGQYLVDQYCRVEDSNLEWARLNQALLCRGGGDGQLNAATDSGNATISAATTPSNTPNKKPKIGLLTDF